MLTQSSTSAPGLRCVFKVEMYLSLLFTILLLNQVASEEVTGTEKLSETEEKDSVRPVEGKALGLAEPAYLTPYGGYAIQAPRLSHAIVNQRILQPHAVPITIPFLDRNGCRFPGDIVCSEDPTDRTEYGLCILSNESKNLWKRPSMQIQNVDCQAGTQVLSDWCNDNERLLRTTGFIQQNDHLSIYNHQKKYYVMISPCIVTT